MTTVRVSPKFQIVIPKEVRERMVGLQGLQPDPRLAELAAPIPGHAAGTRLRGHEFHYSTILSQPDEPLARVTDADGGDVAETGSRRGRVSGTFFHLIARAA